MVSEIQEARHSTLKVVRKVKEQEKRNVLRLRFQTNNAEVTRGN